MGLSKKTFLYSIILAVVMTALITGYFVFMLPSLYVDYMMRSNLESAMEIHKGYLEDKGYDNLNVKNPSSTYTLEIPREGTELFVSGKYFRLTLNVLDKELQTYLSRMKGMFGEIGEAESGYASWEGLQASGCAASPSAANPNTQSQDLLSKEDFTALWELLREKLAPIAPHADGTPVAGSPSADYPLTFEIEQKAGQGVYQKEYSRIHQSPDGFIVFEAGVSDNDYSYTTYVAFSATKDAFLFTVLPTMTPQMDEIRPIVAESMPMIVAVVFLLALLSSRFFSGKIVNPIIHLAGQAQTAANFCGTYTFDTKRKDEIGTLSHALNELYQKLHGSYLALAEKNKILEEENQRQEVFLRATSHQLKTPVTAALLLVEGMKNRVGKYKDTDAWLPEVKKQLLSMRKIVEDILYLNYHTDQMTKEPSSLKALLSELLNLYSVQIESQKLEIEMTGNGIVWADREILKKILDNLLSNAVQYTPSGGRIEIIMKEEPENAEPSDQYPSVSRIRLLIKNYGITIPQELLPDIFEPFVSSAKAGNGRGLGLYVASYYSRLSGIRLLVENGENCVCSLLVFSPKAQQDD